MRGRSWLHRKKKMRWNYLNYLNFITSSNQLHDECISSNSTNYDDDDNRSHRKLIYEYVILLN